MKISTLKELDKLIQLCAKRGVSSITVDGIAFQLVPKTGTRVPKVSTLPDYSSDFPEANVAIPKFTGEVADPEQPSTDELTDEQKLFWSAESREQVN